MATTTKKKAGRRTTLRSSTGTKLYAVRNADGTFKDIQTYQRAHAADLRKTSRAEAASRKTASGKSATKKKAATKKKSTGKANAAARKPAARKTTGRTTRPRS